MFLLHSSEGVRSGGGGGSASVRGCVACMFDDDDKGCLRATDRHTHTHNHTAQREWTATAAHTAAGSRLRHQLITDCNRTAATHALMAVLASSEPAATAIWRSAGLPRPAP